jgi:hypothetical protein
MSTFRGDGIPGGTADIYDQGTLDAAVADAQTAETNAAASAAAALTSENNAAASESAAATSESNAAASETAAGASETAAATSEANAATSETNAAASESAAASSETNSAASATEAYHWAQYAEDALVPEGDLSTEYSAFHWATKAEASAAALSLPNPITALQFLRGNAGGTAWEQFDLFGTTNSFSAAQNFGAINVNTASAGGLVSDDNTKVNYMCGGTGAAVSLGAYVATFGNSHATYPGRMNLVPGSAGQLNIYNSSAQLVLNTTSTGIAVPATTIQLTHPSDNLGLSLQRAATDNYQIRVNDDGAGSQQDASKYSWAISIPSTTSSAGSAFAIYSRAPAGSFASKLKIDGNAAELKLTSTELTFNSRDIIKESTFTAVLRGTTSGAINMSGSYTKNGKQVTISLSYAGPVSAGSLVGNLYITGLPFTANNEFDFPMPQLRGAGTEPNSNFRQCIIINGSTQINLYSTSSGFGDVSTHGGSGPSYPSTSITQNGTTSVLIHWVFSYFTNS